MEARPKGRSAFAAPGGKNKWLLKKGFKMEQVNIEVVKLTPEERTGSLKIYRLKVNQVKFW